MLSVSPVKYSFRGEHATEANTLSLPEETNMTLFLVCEHLLNHRGVVDPHRPRV